MLLIAAELLDSMPQHISAIGGPIGDGSAIVMATGAIAATQGRMLTTFLVDTESGDIWGVLEAGAEVALVDGAVFSGNSLMRAAEIVRLQKAVPAGLLALFDGIGAMAQVAFGAGLDYRFIFDRKDLGLP
jgi:orotate phosphoribosyltransferase